MQEVIPSIGQPWSGQGGINGGLMRGEKGKPDYFLILPTDPSTFITAIEWGGYGIEVPGANHEFDGLENTTALLRAESSHPAAEWSSGLVIDGHNDLYLPARRESSLLIANLPEHFKHLWHWTSTQFSAATRGVSTLKMATRASTASTTRSLREQSADITH